MQATEYLKEILIEDRVLNREDLSEYWRSVSELMEEYHQSKLRQDSTKGELLKKFWKYFDEQCVAVNCNDEERDEVINDFLIACKGI